MHFRRFDFLKGRKIRPAIRFALAFAGALTVATSAGADTFFVNTTDDDPDLTPGDGLCSTGTLITVGPGPLLAWECTLRAAIEEANDLAGSDTVAFSSVLPTVAGVTEFNVTSPLPFITDRITIDGYTAAGYDTTDPNESPIINIGGGSLTGTTAGLSILPGADNSLIRGLAIYSFPGDGILVSTFFSPGPNNVAIEGCHIGINRGVFQRGNDGNGINIAASNNARIGLNCNIFGCSGRRNVIATSGENGIQIASDGTRVAGNLIGTDTFGSSTFVPFGGSTPNAEWGVHVVSGTSNIIGGPRDEAVNLISGNLLGGLLVESGGNTILENKIGTNLAGTGALANQGPGIEMTTGDNTVGSLGTFGANLISGNAGSGILSVSDNQILGNTIGLNEAQDAMLGNGGTGIELIGPLARVEGNTIGGNPSGGILAGGEFHDILSNVVGTNSNGDALAAASTGINVWGNFIEVGRAGEGNTIGFYTDGIVLSSLSNSGTVRGNYIGVDSMGRDIGNSSDGMEILGANHTIGGVGGLTNGMANVIGFNEDGIQLFSSSNDNEIHGNYIGTNAAGDDIGNSDYGVELGGDSNEIGGAASMAAATVTARANVLAFNGDSAVGLDGSALNASVRGNELYANAHPPIDLGLDAATPNDFGDVDTGPNNFQNFPQFDSLQTQYNPVTGNLEVRYRVNSNVADSAYPLSIDFYLINAPNGQADVYVGSDSYSAASATLFRSVAISPLMAGSVDGLVVATATDANGNTSELSVQSIPVPEPGGLALLTGGIPLLGLLGRRRLRTRRA